jgi:hypothetical protein
MSEINLPRLLAGGLLAGLIMNVGEAALHAGILGADTQLLYQSLNAPPPNPGSTIPLLVGTTFLIGLTAVWLYAAIYPRFGGRLKTGFIAGFVVWILSHLWAGVYLGAGYAGIITPRLAWIPVLWGFFEATLATMAGALLYKERVRGTIRSHVRTGV